MKPRTRTRTTPVAARAALVVGCALAVVTCGSGCASFTGAGIPSKTSPSNFRNWKAEFSVLPEATTDGDAVRIKNVRNCLWISDEDFILRRYDRTFRISDVRTVDFFVVPFTGAEIIAHTMISFGLADGTYLAVSVEVRLEEGQTYNPLQGALRQYEIMYVLADEKDVVRLRTGHRKVDVYLYRSTATPEQTQALFRDVMARVQKLGREPEFYDTITNNCTTNIVDHVNRMAADRVPMDLRVILPGLADQYAYDLGLIDRTLPFAETKRRALVNDLADRYFDDPEFSHRIRDRFLPTGTGLGAPSAATPPAATPSP